MMLLTVLSLQVLLAPPGMAAVVFPDKKIERDKRQEEAEILPCPDGQLYCDSITDYPANIKITDTVVASRLIRNAIFDAKSANFTETPLLRSNFLKESRSCDNIPGPASALLLVPLLPILS